MVKKLVILLLAITARSHAQDIPPQQFFLKTDAWLEARKIHSDQMETLREQTSSDAQPLTLQSKSGLNVPALFFDRNSNIALIVGQGLPAPKESMLIYANLFSDYDVIMFDYRWCNNYFSSLIKSIVLCSPTKRILLDEEEELSTVLDFIKQRKNYEKIVGLGECYSNFLFAKIQADEVFRSGKGPFTHLILDSCWHSFKSLAESICSDPWLPIEPQEGGAPWIVKTITNSSVVRWPLLTILFTFLHNVSIEQYLKHLNIPTLFIYGQHDLLVPPHHFEAIWQATEDGKRAVLLTPYQHSENVHNKFIYRFVGEQFVKASTIAEFQDNCDNLV